MKALDIGVIFIVCTSLFNGNVEMLLIYWHTRRKTGGAAYNRVEHHLRVRLYTRHSTPFNIDFFNKIVSLLLAKALGLSIFTDKNVRGCSECIDMIRSFKTLPYRQQLMKICG